MRARRLGSRLYYEFTATALSDKVEWERLADGVAVEVRRQGAPTQSSVADPVAVAERETAPQEDGGRDLVAPAPKSPATQGMGLAALGPLVAAREAAPGVSVNSSVNVHNSNISNNISSSNTVTNTVTNAGNTSTSVATSTVLL